MQLRCYKSCYKLVKMIALLLTILVSNSSLSAAKDSPLLCQGKIHANVSLTAYYPLHSDESEKIDEYTDSKGKRLRTLQDYIDNREEWITVSMDKKLGIPYGANVCIPELNGHFGRYLKFQVRDSSSTVHGRGFSRIEICVRSEVDSFDYAVNRRVTVYFT